MSNTENTKGKYLTELDYEHESHTYNSNQEQIKVGIDLITNETFIF